MSNGWNGYAEEFNDLATFDDQYIHTGLGLKGLEPDRVVGNANCILDVGCGEGTNTYLLHSVRGCRTVGIDIASSAIIKAKEQYEDHLCSFVNCDLETFVKGIEDEVFDLITFWGSLDYLRLDKQFFYELNQITISGSRCYISKFHPMWTALYGNDVEEQITKSYFDNGRVDLVPYGNKNKVFLDRVHYTISYIITEFKLNGWELKEIQEPRPDINTASFKYRNYDSDETLMDRMNNIPMTIIFEFERRE